MQGLSNAGIGPTKREPFNVLAERPSSGDGVSGRPKLEPWAKAYLRNFAGALSKEVRIVAQLVRDAARAQPTSL
jgi:hypothetical protein